MKILIAEDDLTSRAMLAGVLRRSGHEVTTACDGEEAWAALQSPAAPPLAILDWMMPGLDGVEIVRRLRAQPTDQPPSLIVLTAKDETVDLIAALAAGANDYLTKPFDPGELCARVEVGQRMLTLQAALNVKIAELHQALAHIKTLRGIVPICASCKNIRDDQGYWKQVEVYVHDHSEAEFSHGICPACMKKLYPEYTEDLGAEPAKP